jgi:hypothetical protein
LGEAKESVVKRACGMTMNKIFVFVENPFLKCKEKDLFMETIFDKEGTVNVVGEGRRVGRWRRVGIGRSKG